MSSLLTQHLPAGPSKLASFENVKQIGAWFAGTTALDDASVMRFQAGGRENGDGGARMCT